MKRVNLYLFVTLVLGTIFISTANQAYAGAYQNEITSYLLGDEGSPKAVGNKIAKDLKNKLQGKTLGYLKGNEVRLDLGDYDVDFTLSNLIAGSYEDHGDMVQIPVILYYGVNAGHTYFKELEDQESIDGTVGIKLDKETNQLVLFRKKNKITDIKKEFRLKGTIGYKDVRYYAQRLENRGTYNAKVVTDTYPVNLQDQVNIGLNYSEWFQTKPLNLFNLLSLELPPELSVKSKQDVFRIPSVLPDNPEEYVEVLNHMDNGNLIFSWLEKPDPKKSGKQTARVKVTDTLDDYIQEKEVDINFEGTAINADPVPQKIVLGQNISSLNYFKFVTNVKLGDQVLSSDQYKVELINSIATDTVGTKNAKIRVTLKSDTSKTVDIDVPVEVGWGNSVVYGGDDYGGSGRTSAAFTLYKGEIPSIVASQGQNDDNLPIHSNFPNQQYYTFNWFDLSNKQILKIDESNNGDKYIKANGDELKKDKLKEWGTAQNQAVNYGDIVRAWQTETSKNWLYENEQKQAYNDVKKAVYYEITTSGYRPLHFNQLTPKTGKIPIYSTNKYLDEHVKDYIDLKGYSNINLKGFSEYPDTTSSGDKRAKILVEETLTTGKKVQYEYEVTINVEPGTLTYTVPKTLTFKDFSKSKNEQIVKRKKDGSLGLYIKDNRGSNSQGNWTLTAKVSSDSKSIAPYLIYRNKEGADSYLNGSAVPIYTQKKQSKASEPLEVDVSSKWKSTDGILLKVPSKNTLVNQEYSTTITWNLVEGP